MLLLLRFFRRFLTLLKSALDLSLQQVYPLLLLLRCLSPLLLQLPSLLDQEEGLNQPFCLPSFSIGVDYIAHSLQLLHGGVSDPFKDVAEVRVDFFEICTI